MSLLGDAETLVAKAIAAGADQAEAYLETGSSLDLELEQSRLSGSGLSTESGGAIRVIKDKKLGFAYFTMQSDAPSAIDAALSASKLAEPLDMHFAGNGQASKLPDQWFDEVAKLDVDIALQGAKELLEGVHEVCPDAVVSGGISMGWGKHAIATSEGASHESRGTHAQAVASVVLADGERSVNAWDVQTRHDLPDARHVGEHVGHTVMSLRKPQKAKAGACQVVFRPDAVAELITGLIGGAVDGDSAMRGKSFWSDKQDSDVAPGLTLVDDPLHPDAIGGDSFDGEGRTTSARSIIDKGQLTGFIFDARDAARHGQNPTGHSQRGGAKSPPGTDLHNICISTETSKPEAKLLAEIDHGYLIDSVLGAHTANATTGDFSVTAVNVWRINGGELVASKEIAIGGNLPELLHRLDTSSTEVRRMPGALLPTLSFADVQVSA